MGPDSGSVISWWAEAPCCRWLAALFGCPSQSRGSSPRLQPSSSSTRSQGVQSRKGKHHNALLYGKYSNSRTSRSTARAINLPTSAESSNKEVTVGERKFPKEVVVAYVDYCKRASVCEENQRVCHMCVFIEQRCQNYIVKQSKKPGKLYATNYFGSSIITLAFDIVHLLPILDEATG
ncbi:Os03g0802050 [Oryza sativa Japonica Group]|uniref:Os03g0802050 protein n=2 Tax=Oryza TaxID=4527 RepID=C7IZI8_ORYSJ|nr:Os03g0802050 [Oryza sativa Japonica Group]|eukprot:NP_001173674.1 Os03g0802050 [Oryza sativa Japonica Group]